MKRRVPHVVCRILVLHAVQNVPANTSMAVVCRLVEGGAAVDSGWVFVDQVGHDHLTDLEASVPGCSVEWGEPVSVGRVLVGNTVQDKPANVHATLPSGNVQRCLTISGAMCPIPTDSAF